jgi:cobalamin biosynthesis Co2+ chelatase CbiK
MKVREHLLAYYTARPMSRTYESTTYRRILKHHSNIDVTTPVRQLHKFFHSLALLQKHIFPLCYFNGLKT